MRRNILNFAKNIGKRHFHYTSNQIHNKPTNNIVGKIYETSIGIHAIAGGIIGAVYMIEEEDYIGSLLYGTAGLILGTSLGLGVGVCSPVIYPIMAVQKTYGYFSEKILKENKNKDLYSKSK